MVGLALLRAAGSPRTGAMIVPVSAGSPERWEAYYHAAHLLHPRAQEDARQHLASSRQLFAELDDAVWLERLAELEAGIDRA